MKRALKVAGSLVGVLVVVVAAVYAWVSFAANRAYARTVAVHEVDFPVPFPLDSAEMAALGAEAGSADSVAMARAVERGRHLVDARYGCRACHGEDFGGGVMIDAPPIGRLLGPNLTGGTGGVTAAYGPPDWDRIVRHGIGADGTPTAMPAEDFQRMSDRELSDIVAFLGTVPPVDNEVPPVSLGPIGKLLIATGAIGPAYDRIAEHQAPHAPHPPAAEASVAFGRHLAAVCTGCHREDLSGGPIAGGDPSWVPAANLTPHADGLERWTLADFTAALRDGVRPDGSRIRAPMDELTAYGQRMTDVELEALWTYLRSLPAMATPE